jgi:hypothetical protein
MVIILLIACEDNIPVPSPNSTSGISTPIVQPTIAAAPDQTSLRSKLQMLSFGHENEIGGHVFKD